MSNSDGFIDEVSEELRRDKMFGLMRKYGWIAVVLVLMVVGGAAYYEWQKAQARASAEAFGDSVLSAIEADPSDARLEGLRDVNGNPVQQGVLNLLIASETLALEDRDATLAALEAVAQNEALPLSYRQLATLKRVIVAGDALPLAEREAALGGLAQAGQAFRPLALEQMALLRAGEGDTEGALALLNDLLSGPDVTQVLRRRAQQLVIALGGELDAA
ncbi:hypothetical protein [Roseicitreum antarcticum]|uniref:Tetratricopeptide repeat-like domain-containing protein n=1 Tax=Roseicitreum antarcticum TaxID=564137 RepID=A0A1H2W8G4_9RHOB|nr:hypothetical protein [Roseicitreum antarcticum]SDW76746.1 hypothetical protein SAMN04488238_103297 [Roseicitreum antarcticum]